MPLYCPYAWSASRQIHRAYNLLPSVLRLSVPMVPKNRELVVDVIPLIHCPRDSFSSSHKVQMPLVLRGLSALMRSDVLCESSECDFRAALRLNRLIAQTSEIDAKLP